MSRVRWLIVILGPLPIIGSSWALSGWFGAERVTSAAPNLVAAARPAVVADDGAAAPSMAAAKPPVSRPPRRSEGASPLADDCQRTAARLTKSLGAGCQVIARPPFVVAGDLRREALEALYADTILPAERAMRARYFVRRPSEPVSVLVFSGEASYNRYCNELFGDSGISVYGYYKPQLRTLALNLATGGGTLTHELTHALVDFDFPQVPAWFNEGLASLHEQCRFRSDPRGPWIEGLVNWRLPPLRKLAEHGQLRSLEALLAEPNFRGPREGTNYAQARYFCMYMQRKGVLEEFYRTFRDDRLADPRGLKAVGKVFPRMSWRELDDDFRKFVLELPNPR